MLPTGLLLTVETNNREVRESARDRREGSLVYNLEECRVTEGHKREIVCVPTQGVVGRCGLWREREREKKKKKKAE